MGIVELSDDDVECSCSSEKGVDIETVPHNGCMENKRKKTKNLKRKIVTI